jgi:hypothetical protein
MIPPEYAVGLRLTVIPDGLDNGQLRLCIGANPDPDGADYDLRDWPRVAAEKLARIRILAADIGGTISVNPDGVVTDNRTVDSARIAGPAAGDFDASQLVRATQLWRQIFSDGGSSDDTFNSGIAALKRGLAARQFGPDTKPSKRVGFVSTSDLTSLTDALVAAPAARALKLRAAALKAKATKAAKPDDQGLGEGPGLGWWLQQHASWLGADAPQTPTQKLLAQFGAKGVAAKRQSAAGLGEGSLKALAADVVRVEQLRLGGDTTAQTKDRSRPKKRGGDSRLPEPEPIGGAVKALVDGILDGKSWTATMASVTTTSTTSPLFAAALAWQRLESISSSEGDSPDWTPTQAQLEEEAAGRKLSGILSYPSLSKFLGLVVDCEIATSAVFGTSGLDRRVRAIAADEHADSPTLPQPGDVVWTSALWTKAGYLGPCPRLETRNVKAATDPIYVDGCLNLAAKTPDGPRYSLIHDDGASRVLAFGQRAREVASAYAAGRSFASTDEPPREGRGISLVDNTVAEHHLQATERDDALSKAPRAKFPIQDAEDLLQGYRLDVAIGSAPKGKPAPAAEQWRTLMARELQFGDRDVPSAWQAKLSARIRARDDGHVRPMTREAMNGDETPVVHDVLATWQGDALGIAALADVRKGQKDDTQGGRYFWPSPYSDLAVDIAFDAPFGALPELRNDKDVWMGGRLCFSHGCGMTLSEVTNRYATASPTQALGPYRYRRTLRVRAPQVLLPPDSPIVTTKAAPPPGESIDDLIVHSTAPNVVTRRLAIPDQVPVDLAEQAGMFDRPTEGDKPEGAFAGVLLRAIVDPASGHFPLARKGDWSTEPPSEDKEEERSRGLVLVLDKAAKDTDAPFYPDPMARILYARLLTVDGQPNSNFGGQANPPAFWAANSHPSSAEPIAIELRARSSGALGALWGRINEGDTQAEIPVEHSGGSTVDVRKLAVELRPAQQAILELWSDPHPDILLDSHEVASSARRLLKGQGIPDDQLKAALTQAPLRGVHEYRRVRVVHAVDRPLAHPSVEKGEDIRAITLTVSPEPPKGQSAVSQTDGDRPLRWSEYVAKQSADTSTWPSQEGGATTFFVGKIRISRLSTGAARCEAAWEDYRPDGYEKDGKGKWLYKSPPNLARLFSMDFQQTPMGDDLVDLLRSDTDGSVLALSHTFADGRARSLAFRLIATSRFTGCFEATPQPAQDGKVGRYETGSPDPAVTTYRAWTRCTFRPPPPDIDRILPTFDWKDSREHYLISFERTSALRVYLKRNWFASGEDELLGLVFTEQELNSACDFDTLGRFGEFLTRSGADPIHLSGPDSGLVTPERPAPAPPKPITLPGPTRIAGYDGAIETHPLRLAHPKPEDGGVESIDEVLPVRVAAFRPEFDPSWGHFCDIEVTPAATYHPFLQLGLTRFQRHAVGGLELSHPVARIVQAPPTRKGSVELKYFRKLVVRLEGDGFHLSHLSEPDAPVLANRPLLNVWLVEAADPDGVPDNGSGHVHWRPVQHNGQPVQVLHQPPDDMAGDFVRWTVTIEMPQPEDDQRFGLLIEEVELMDQDNSLIASNASGGIAERAAFFSKYIDLADWTNLNG